MLKQHHTHEYHHLSLAQDYRRTVRTYGLEVDVDSARGRALAEAVAPVAHKAAVGVVSDVEGVVDSPGVENAARDPRV